MRHPRQQAGGGRGGVEGANLTEMRKVARVVERRKLEGRELVVEGAEKKSR